MRKRVAVLAGCGVALAAQPGAAQPVAATDSCDSAAPAARRARADCRPPGKIEPYDPDRVRAGRQPGFIDLGNGTELRVGGRARVDADTRR